MAATKTTKTKAMADKTKKIAKAPRPTPAKTSNKPQKLSALDAADDRRDSVQGLLDVAWRPDPPPDALRRNHQGDRDQGDGVTLQEDRAWQVCTGVARTDPAT